MSKLDELDKAVEETRLKWYKIGLEDGKKDGKLEEREAMKNNFMGILVKNSTGFDTIGGKKLWHIDLNAVEADILNELK